MAFTVSEAVTRCRRLQGGDTAGYGEETWEQGADALPNGRHARGVTVIQAAFLTGKTRQTINKFTKNGKLSFARNSEGAKVIEIAELQRVFPLVKTMVYWEQAQLGGSEPATGTNVSGGEGSAVAVLQVELEAVRRECEAVRSERERERRQLEDRIADLQSALEKAQEQGSRAMALLTDQSEGGRTLRADQEVIRELAQRVERLSQQNRRIYRELQEQKKRGFWQWLTGGGEAAAKPAPNRPQTKTA